MGLSMALHESSVMDPRFGHVVNHDFAGYHIAATPTSRPRGGLAGGDDPHANPMGVKGIGEIGIVGRGGGHRQRRPPCDRHPGTRPADHPRSVPLRMMADFAGPVAAPGRPELCTYLTLGLGDAGEGATINRYGTMIAGS